MGQASRFPTTTRPDFTIFVNYNNNNGTATNPTREVNCGQDDFGASVKRKDWRVILTNGQVDGKLTGTKATSFNDINSTRDDDDVAINPKAVRRDH
jgi:hypothetical protein